MRLDKPTAPGRVDIRKATEHSRDLGGDRAFGSLRVGAQRCVAARRQATPRLPNLDATKESEGAEREQHPLAASIGFELRVLWQPLQRRLSGPAP